MKRFLIPLSKIRPSRTWAILGVAVGIGLLAAMAARNYLSNQVAALEAGKKGATVSVVVAKTDLPKGTRLSTDNLAVRSIPKDYAHSAAVMPEQFEHVAGQPLAYPVKGGEMVIWSMLEGRKVPTFSARIEAGRRAMTVPVDEISSISGLLEPGDVIDLMVTVDRADRKVTIPLLQSVVVMATGQRSVDDPKSGERRQYSTVTLDTTPEQAQHVIVAREAGKITALLRNPEDKTALRAREANLADLWGGGAGPTQRPMLSGPSDIPVLYGGQSGKLVGPALRLGGQAAESAEGAQLMVPNAELSASAAPLPVSRR
ncbi:Flp pilus assembly protein CpaB [Aquincola sp. MAHUQ-54]|uniref:Flp pilus assembly protein CpaB n=1 Tax=Aquincola agrisoli TaxID=3119538 RepID=A0AAW9Q9D3_9BURK